MSLATVHRIGRKYGLQPHRLEHFKFSTDPEFETKLSDIVGLYLDPPERALVLCVDQKAQMQTLKRTAPRLAQSGRALARAHHRPGHPPRSFTTVTALERQIIRFLDHWNQNAKPLVWTKTAAQINRSIHKAKLISET